MFSTNVSHKRPHGFSEPASNRPCIDQSAFANIPRDVVELIFDRLSTPDKLSCALTCKRWYTWLRQRQGIDFSGNHKLVSIGSNPLLSSLRHLSIPTSLTSNLPYYFPQLSQLGKLTLDMTLFLNGDTNRHTEEAESFIAQSDWFTCVKSLEFAHKWDLFNPTTPSLLSSLSRLSQLQALSLSLTEKNGYISAALTSLSQLTTLKVKLSPAQLSHVDALTSLSALKSLRLQLNNEQIVAPFALKVAHLTALTSLNIASDDPVLDVCVFSRLTALRKLSFYGTHIKPFIENPSLIQTLSGLEVFDCCNDVKGWGHDVPPLTTETYRAFINTYTRLRSLYIHESDDEILYDLINTAPDELLNRISKIRINFLLPIEIAVNRITVSGQTDVAEKIIRFLPPVQCEEIIPSLERAFPDDVDQVLQVINFFVDHGMRPNIDLFISSLINFNFRVSDDIFERIKNENYSIDFSHKKFDHSAQIKFLDIFDYLERKNFPILRQTDRISLGDRLLNPGCQHQHYSRMTARECLSRALNLIHSRNLTYLPTTFESFIETNHLIDAEILNELFLYGFIHRNMTFPSGRTLAEVIQNSKMPDSIKKIAAHSV